MDNDLGFLMKKSKVVEFVASVFTIMGAATSQKVKAYGKMRTVTCISSQLNFVVASLQKKISLMNGCRAKATLTAKIQRISLLMSTLGEKVKQTLDMDQREGVSSCAHKL